jgi:dolichol-phosphate mannosyltransferase
MLRHSRIAVVIPCLDVAPHVTEVLATLPDFVDHVVVVDDGSRDGLEAAVALSADTRIVLERHTENRGLARAMETGVRRALALGADVIVKMDGDGQMDPAELPRLLGPILEGHTDLAKGNRFLRRRHLTGMPRARLGGNLVLSFMAKLASGYWNVFDPTNGYLAVRRQVLEEVDLGRLGPGYFFEISLLCEAYLTGAVVRDVAMPARYGSERSSLSIRRIMLDFPWRLARACARRITLQYFIRDFTPVALFLVTGSVLAGFGFLFGLSNWFENAGTGRPTPTGTIILAVLPLLVGFQLLLQALVMDIGNVPMRSPWGRRDP